MRGPRGGVAAGALAYAMGGTDGTVRATAGRYDFATGAVTAAGNIPTATFGGASGGIQSHCYGMGGDDGAAPRFTAVFRMAVATDTAANAPTALPAGNAYQGGASDRSDVIWAFGGNPATTVAHKYTHSTDACVNVAGAALAVATHLWAATCTDGAGIYIGSGNSTAPDYRKYLHKCVLATEVTSNLGATFFSTGSSNRAAVSDNTTAAFCGGLFGTYQIGGERVTIATDTLTTAAGNLNAARSSDCCASDGTTGWFAHGQDGGGAVADCEEYAHATNVWSTAAGALATPTYFSSTSSNGGTT